MSCCNTFPVSINPNSRERNRCLGYEVSGSRCRQRLPGAKRFCRRHEPISGLGFDSNTCPSSVPRTKCKVVAESSSTPGSSNICNKKGLFGLEICYQHFDGVLKTCVYCEKVKKHRKTVCGHEMCVSCFVEKETCPSCGIDHQKVYPTEIKHIPYTIKVTINSLFRTRMSVSSEAENDRICGLIQKFIEPYKNLFCPCCESEDPSGSSIPSR